MSADVQARDRDVTATVGMIVFLGSWAVMFGALFFTFAAVRVRSAEWPPEGLPRLPLLLPTIATGLLALSIVTRRGLTIALGAAFLVLQGLVWRDAWQSGLRLDHGPYGAYFYLLTVFHAAHALVGLGLLAWVRGRNPVLFWHFVGGAWLCTYLLVYVA